VNKVECGLRIAELFENLTGERSGRAASRKDAHFDGTGMRTNLIE